MDKMNLRLATSNVDVALSNFTQQLEHCSDINTRRSMLRLYFQQIEQTHATIREQDTRRYKEQNEQLQRRNEVQTQNKKTDQILTAINNGRQKTMATFHSLGTPAPSRKKRAEDNIWIQ